MFRYLQPPRVGEIINKVKPKRLSPPSPSTFSQNQFPPQNHFSNTKNIENNASPHSSKNTFVVDPTFSPFEHPGDKPVAGGFFPQQAPDAGGFFPQQTPTR